MKTGICSITFRRLSPEEVARLVAQAGLDAIEWGGDIHVPHGAVKTAEQVRRLTLDAGLEVSSYGSYYSPLAADGRAEDFAPVLDAALGLGAKTIRIWPGRKAAEHFDAPEYGRFVEQSRKAAERAQQQGVKLAFEFHVGGLAETHEGAVRLLADIAHPNVYSYWQPPYWLAGVERRMESLTALKPHLLNLHVFHWTFDDEGGTKAFDDAVTRRPLEEGADEWAHYFNEISATARYALLEFVPDDSTEQFLRDAATLLKVVAAI